jgi:hypothetical protein
MSNEGMNQFLVMNLAVVEDDGYAAAVSAFPNKRIESFDRNACVVMAH